MNFSLERRSILKRQLEPGTPINPGPSPRRGDTAVTIKRDTEKDYDGWHRGRCTKDDISVLQSDEGYIVWLPKFRAELEHQGLINVFDVDKDPADLVPDSFEWKLQQGQRCYLWTVLICVFENPLGTSSISVHNHSRDAR